MLFTIKQLLEGSKKMMGVWFAETPKGGTEKQTYKFQTIIEQVGKILDRSDLEEDGHINYSNLDKNKKDILRKILMESKAGSEILKKVIAQEQKLSLEDFKKLDYEIITDNTKEELGKFVLEEGLIPKSLEGHSSPTTLNGLIMDVTNSTPQKPLIFEQAPVSKPEEKTENLTPEEIEQARNIVSNFKDTDSSNENKVEELQRALVILGYDLKVTGKFQAKTGIALNMERDRQFLSPDVNEFLKKQKLEELENLLSLESYQEFGLKAKELGYQIGNLGDEIHGQTNYYNHRREIDLLKSKIKAFLSQNELNTGKAQEAKVSVVPDSAKEATNQRAFDKLIMTLNYKQIQGLLEAPDLAKALKDNGYELSNSFFQWLSGKGNEVEAVKTRLQNIVNNQESIKNELKEGNFKNALSTIMDFDANGVLSAENKVNFYYEEKQVFDGVNKEQLGNILANFGYGATGGEAFEEFNKVFTEGSYYKAREQFKERIGILEHVPNSLNLAALRNGPKVLKEFYEEVNKREGIVSEAVRVWAMLNDVNEETKLAIQGMLKNKLAKENNVFDDKFDVNEYVKSELEEINKDIEKIKASVDEYVKNNKNIPEKSKNDKGFLDALKNRHIQLILTNKAYGATISWNVSEATSGLLDTAGFGIVGGTPGIFVAKSFQLGERVNLTAGTSNFIPFISANVVLTEGDLKEQLNGNLNSYKTYSANEVSLDANFSTKGSSIGISVDRLTENTQKGIEKAVVEMEKNYNEAIEAIISNNPEYEKGLKTQEDKRVFGLIKQMLPIIGGGDLRIGAERLSQGMKDRFRIDMYEKASKEGWNISKISVGLAFVSGYFAIPFININAEHNYVKWVKTGEGNVGRAKVIPGVEGKTDYSYYEGVSEDIIKTMNDYIKNISANGETRNLPGAGEVLNLKGTIDSRWNGLIKLVENLKPPKNYKAFLVVLREIENPISKQQYIDAITIKLHTSFNFGGEWNKDNTSSRIKIEDTRRKSYNETLGFNATSYWNEFKGILGKPENSGKISSKYVNTTFVDASSPLLRNKVAQKDAQGQNISIAGVELISVNGKELLIPVSQEDTANFIKNLKVNEYNKEYIEKIKDLFNGTEKVELYFAKDAYGFDDVLVIKVGAKIEPIPSEIIKPEGWRRYLPETGTDSFGILLAYMREKEKKRRPGTDTGENEEETPSEGETPDESETPAESTPGDTGTEDQETPPPVEPPVTPPETPTPSEGEGTGNETGNENPGTGIEESQARVNTSPTDAVPPARDIEPVNIQQTQTQTQTVNPGDKPTPVAKQVNNNSNSSNSNSSNIDVGTGSGNSNSNSSSSSNSTNER